MIEILDKVAQVWWTEHTHCSVDGLNAQQNGLID